MQNLQKFKVATFIFWLALTILFFTTACGSNKMYFENSSVAPAARGYVKMDRDKNSNYVIEAEIYNLAEVDRLQLGKKTYVVWLESKDQTAKNIGQLVSVAKKMRSQPRATFKSVSATKPTKIFITAEEDGNASVNGSMVVLSTSTF